MKKIRIALGQINPIVGNFDFNRSKIVSAIESATSGGADLILFPELSLCGYPPEDLLLKKSFCEENRLQLYKIMEDVKDIIAIVGYAESRSGVYNAAAILHNGQHCASCHKIDLPNYSVFDEKRNFKAGSQPLIIDVNGLRVGVNICEDIWPPNEIARQQVIMGNAELIVNISASPYHVNRQKEREEMIRACAIKNEVAIAYVNMVGGQDELIFDGASIIADATGLIVARGKQFEEDLIYADLHLKPSADSPQKAQAEKQGVSQVRIQKVTGTQADQVAEYLPDTLNESEEMLQALILGTRDYARKNGFNKAVLGLSGGIDSALTAAIAQRALGASNVIGVLMPSRFSSTSSIDDSLALAENLGIKTHTLRIEEIVHSYENILEPIFKNLQPDIAEENIQARTRGNLLMALSNKFGWLVLTTGNKSETSVGYCTLYGDMAGGFAVLKDVLKTHVFSLCRHLNKDREVIPENTITKPPSAELRPDQKDEDSLPPYDILDAILKQYVEQDKSVAEISVLGVDATIIKEIVKLVDRNEYKRRQAPPGIRITSKAFGRDRRMPLTNHFSTIEIKGRS